MISSLANQRVLVTGGTGFIGSHLTRRLVHEGAKVSILTRHESGTSRIEDVLGEVEIHEVDIRNFGAVNAAIETLRPRVVFHLAAAGVTEPFLSTNLALRVNVDGTINVIRASATAGAERIIHTGTAYEYGDQAASKQIDPISPYAAAKAAAWAFSQMYFRTMGWPIICLRLFQVYGPGQAGTLIPSAIQAALKGHPFPTTAGEQTRDWIYVDDVVDAYLNAALAEGIEGETFDIGTGVGTSVREVVEFVFEQFPGASPLIGGIDYRPGEVWSLVADTEKARSQLGWQARVKLKDGLRRTVDELSAPAPTTETAAASPDNRQNGGQVKLERDRLRVEILDKVS
jgi:UDP-glucose 4-epimerase